MSKRIAIQLFGHLRSFRMTYKSLIKNIVESNKKDGYEVDIFIHTWTETDHSDKTWNNPHGLKRGSEVTEDIINEIYKYYNPKKLLIENQIKVDNHEIKTKNGSPIQYKAKVNMAYTASRSSEIRRDYARKQNISYDYVIVTRPDLMFYESLSLNDYLSKYKKRDIAIPSNGLFVSYFFNNEIGNQKNVLYDKRFILNYDILFWGTEQAIDKATDLYQKVNLENYYKDGLWYDLWIQERLEPIRMKYNERVCFGERISFSVERVGKKSMIKKIIKLLKNIIICIVPYGIVKLKYHV